MIWTCCVCKTQNTVEPKDEIVSRHCDACVCVVCSCSVYCRHCGLVQRFERSATCCKVCQQSFMTAPQRRQATSQQEVKSDNLFIIRSDKVGMEANEEPITTTSVNTQPPIGRSVRDSNPTSLSQIPLVHAAKQSTPASNDSLTMRRDDFHIALAAAKQKAAATKDGLFRDADEQPTIPSHDANRVVYRSFIQVLGTQHIVDPAAQGADGGGVRPCDVRQGNLDCWLISALALVAQHAPEAIRAAFPLNPCGSDGVIPVRLWVGGEWKIFIVDSFLPFEGGTARENKESASMFCSFLCGDQNTQEKTSLSLAYARGSIWAALLEKAFAKIAAGGSYEKLTGGHPLEAYLYLTGKPCFAINSDDKLTPWDPTSLHQFVCQGRGLAGGEGSGAHNYITSATCRESVPALGLVADHVYAIDDASTKAIVKLLDPWGAANTGDGDISISWSQFSRSFSDIYFYTVKGLSPVGFENVGKLSPGAASHMTSEKTAVTVRIGVDNPSHHSLDGEEELFIPSDDVIERDMLFTVQGAGTGGLPVTVMCSQGSLRDGRWKVFCDMAIAIVKIRREDDGGREPAERERPISNFFSKLVSSIALSSKETDTGKSTESLCSKTQIIETVFVSPSQCANAVTFTKSLTNGTYAIVPLSFQNRLKEKANNGGLSKYRSSPLTLSVFVPSNPPGRGTITKVNFRDKCGSPSAIPLQIFLSDFLCKAILSHPMAKREPLLSSVRDGKSQEHRGGAFLVSLWSGQCCFALVGVEKRNFPSFTIGRASSSKGKRITVDMRGTVGMHLIPNSSANRQVTFNVPVGRCCVANIAVARSNNGNQYHFEYVRRVTLSGEFTANDDHGDESALGKSEICGFVEL